MISCAAFYDAPRGVEVDDLRVAACLAAAGGTLAELSAHSSLRPFVLQIRINP